MSIGKGTKSGKLLREFIERIENIRERKKSLGDDEKAIFAEAKAGGFEPKTMRRVLTLRQQKPEERQEAETLLDTYLHAIGMAEEPPLFAAFAKAGIDLARREEAVEFLKKIVPHAGEFVLKLGGGAHSGVPRCRRQPACGRGRRRSRPEREGAKARRYRRSRRRRDLRCAWLRPGAVAALGCRSRSRAGGESRTSQTTEGSRCARREARG